MNDAANITALLKFWRAGTTDAARALEAEVYTRLKQMARQRLRGGSSNLGQPQFCGREIAIWDR